MVFRSLPAIWAVPLVLALSACEKDQPPAGAEAADAMAAAGRGRCKCRRCP